MTSGLRPLGDYHIGAGRLRLLAMMNLAAHHYDLHAVIFHRLNELGRHGEARDKNLDLLLDQNRNIGTHHVGNRGEQIHGEWFIRELAGLANLIAHLLGRATGRANDTESSRIRNGSGKPAHRNTAHSGEDDWIFDSEVVTNRRVKHGLYDSLCGGL